MLSQGSWMLQGYFVTLIPWKSHTSLSAIFVQHYSVWIQIHGLPLKHYNVEAACYFGNLLGKFICYDEDSHLNSYGLRVQICLSELGLNFINCSSFHWLYSNILGVSLVLEQVGKLCSYCLGMGHVAKNCNLPSSLQPQVLVSVLGSKSGNDSYDDFSGIYNSTARESGIRIGFVSQGLGRGSLKRKAESFDLDNTASKIIRKQANDGYCLEKNCNSGTSGRESSFPELSLLSTNRKCKNAQQLTSASLLFKRARLSSKNNYEDDCIMIGFAKRRKRKWFP